MFALTVRPATRAVSRARPDESALMSTDAPRGAMDMMLALLIDQSTRAGVLPDRVATDTVR